jgi:DNA ligase D-like protein (predicted 3'-phosphoesterase)
MVPKKTYEQKRNFEATPEPEPSGSSPEGEPIFVIQQHDARSLHFDFRLEINGALKSWAVPKGPSTDPSEKRLAIPTENHPMEYADFEGVIPEGQYGAGTVMVWDKGTFENLKSKDGNTVSLEQSYQDGKIEVFLKGEKIYGGYALIEMKNRDSWLLIKMDDEHADARRNPTSTQNQSVKTGRTLNEIKQENQDD